MALDIDAFAVLRAINSNHATFSGVRADASKAAGVLVGKLRMLLVKQIKSSAGDLGAIKDIRRALGAETFNLVVDGMKDTELKATVGKLDKHHADQKTASSAWRRSHLRALAEGSVQHAAKAPKSGKARGAKGGGRKSRTKPDKGSLDFLFDESAGAVRKR
jgi:hypothetical protein